MDEQRTVDGARAQRYRPPPSPPPSSPPPQQQQPQQPQQLKGGTRNVDADEQPVAVAPTSLGLLQLCQCAATAGVVARTFAHPLDTVRARMMVSPVPTTLARTARDAVASGGARALYRGFGVSVVVQAPAVATYLTVYEKSKAWLTRRAGLDATGAANHLLSGLSAEAVSAVFWTPMEVVKQRAQVGARDTSSAQVVRQVWRAEGARAFFRGYAITIGVFGPYAALYFMAYEKLKLAATRATQLPPDGVLPSWAVLGSAAASGAFAAGATTPLDVIKTRMQVGAASDQQQQRGGATSWQLAKRVMRDSAGVRALFRGLSARVLWIMPNTAITMVTFEWLKARATLGTAL